MSERRLDDNLSVKDGRLYVERIRASELVERFGSPLFVVSEDQLLRNLARFRAAFGAGWTRGPVQLLPAVKASWGLAVQRALALAGAGADVYSEGELEIALRSGVDPSMISVNGVPKSRAHIERTLAAGARLTIDSLEDVRILEQITRPQRACVRLRLRPAVSRFVRASDFVPEGPMPTDLAALGYKGGLSFDEVVEAGRRVRALEGVELVGFHQHHGRHDPSTDWWEAQMIAYAAEIARVCAALGGLRPRELDVGGGFAIPRDPHNAATDYSAPLQFTALYGLSRLLAPLGAKARYGVIRRLTGVMRSAPNAVAAPSIEDYARVVTTTLGRELDRHRVDTRDLVLQLEPGRSLHGNTGVHLSTVRSVKRQKAPITWNVVTLDTSEFFLTGGRFEHHLHAHLVCDKADAPRTLRADVTGRSCYADRLMSAVDLPEVEVGDVLALLDTGAYQDGSASNFNAMSRPATVMVRGDEAFVVRRAEQLDDVLARDLLPPHLTHRQVAHRPALRERAAPTPS